MNFMYQEFLTSLGFGNIYRGPEAVGFQFKFTIPYYRGVWLSQISGGFMVKVDGVEYPLDKVSIKVQDRVIPWSEVDYSYDLFWPYGSYATVIVEKPGGLTVGLHKVEVGLSIRRSYMDEDPAVQHLYDFGDRRMQAPPPEAEKGSEEGSYNPMQPLQTCSLDMVLVM
ncbi:MAG: hypothetical protein JXA61_05330 [Bacteroidales bacterium]|nr:hypothetical protein [Bacteroidales bacterium]